jgi:hypothetical protein
MGTHRLQDDFQSVFPLLTRQNRRQWLASVASAAAASAVGFGTLALAQAARSSEKIGPLADPREFTLDLPNGPIRPGNDRCVLCHPSPGEQVVARVWVEVGPDFVVLLPNGRLIALPQDETTHR